MITFKHEDALYKGRLLPKFQFAARFHACTLSSVGSLHCCDGSIAVTEVISGLTYKRGERVSFALF